MAWKSGHLGARIESPQAVYVVEATAGSGKTQLALRL